MFISDFLPKVQQIYDRYNVKAYFSPLGNQHQSLYACGSTTNAFWVHTLYARHPRATGSLAVNATFKTQAFSVLYMNYSTINTPHPNSPTPSNIIY